MITGKAYVRILTALGIAAMLAVGCSGNKDGGMDPILPAGDPGGRQAMGFGETITLFGPPCSGM